MTDTQRQSYWKSEDSRPHSDPWWMRISAPDFQRNDLPCQELYKKLEPYGLDPFFTENDEYDTRSKSFLLARSACYSCPIQVECLEYALVSNVPQGIWGGTTPKERVHIQRKRRRNQQSPQEGRKRQYE